MKLNDVQNLQKGTKLWVSEGNGWYQVMEYNTTCATWSLGKMTFSQLMKCDVEFKQGRKQTLVEMIDDKGKTHLVNPRRLSLYEERL